MVPCNYIHTHLGWDKDSIADVCIDNLEKQIEYLGPLDFMIYYTEEVFKQSEYDTLSIQQQSMLKNQQVDQTTPNWINTMVQSNVLSDETQLFQFGYADETTFYSYSSKMPEPSAWNKFPTVADPKSRYKFTSIEVNFSLDQ